MPNRFSAKDLKRQDVFNRAFFASLIDAQFDLCFD